MNSKKILDYEYPQSWPTFVQDLVNSNKTTYTQYMNSFSILSHMREKFFDSSKEISWLKARDIREFKADFFSHIFFLCESVLKKSDDTLLMHRALQTLLEYIIWIPPKLIFETCFFRLLIQRLDIETIGCISMKLLIKIVQLCPPKYNETLICLFSEYMMLQAKMLSPTGNFAELYKNTASFREKLHYLTCFLYIILKKQGELLRRSVPDSFGIALEYLVSICLVNNPELLRLCMEYFNILVRSLCCEKMTKGIHDHKSIISKLCRFIVTNISKPETIVHLNDKGYKSEISVVLYLNMKDILVFLTYLDHVETLKVIVQELYNQIKSDKLSVKRLESLCCAAGVINNRSLRIKDLLKKCIPREVERQFFWTMIRGLLTLSKFIKGKRKKIILALNLMSIIESYAHCLTSRWDILKGVTIKLFDFMHGTDRRTKDLACKTFIRVAQKCKKKFIKKQPGENAAFYNEILKKVNGILPILEPQQVIFLYQALGQILSAHSSEDSEEIIKKRIQRFMAPQNENWEKILKQINESHEFLHHPAFINDILSVLSINTGLCKGIGFKYVYQLHKIFCDILNLYNNMSRVIYYEVQNAKGDTTQLKINVTRMRTVKKEVLILISTWISSIKEDQEHNRFLLDFLPYLIGGILGDYYHCPIESLRESQVLTLLTTIINSLKSSVSEKIKQFFSFVLECSATMFQKHNKFLKIRRHFLLFINAIITHCFGALEEMFSSVNVKFEIILTSVIWSVKQEKEEDVKLGLETLSLLLNKIHQSKINQEFYETYYLIILEEIFFVVINRLYLSDFQGEAIILSKMLKLIGEKEIKKPLNCFKQEHNMPNDIYVQFFIAGIFQREFQYLTAEQLEFVTNGFLKYHRKVQALVDYLHSLPRLLKDFKEENTQIATAAKRKRQKQSQNHKKKMLKK